MKLFEVAEDEYVASETAEEASILYKDLVGKRTYAEVLKEFGAPIELNKYQLDNLRF